MRLGMVGLGRMGGSMAVRLVRAGHEVVGYTLSDEGRRRGSEQGLEIAGSLDELAAALSPPRVVWLMIPAGEPTEATVRDLAASLDEGDVIVDGGNSNFTDSVRRAAVLDAQGIHFLDVGVSGGVWGLDEGYCLMAGGTAEAVEPVRPAFEALAQPEGWAHVGASGSGHFVKMVHNAIEYGMLQAYGEGFELMESSVFDLDLAQVAAVWRRGSVVRSWLLDLLAAALEREADLATVRGHVDDSGEGRWAVLTALDQEVPAPVTALSLFARFASRQDDSFSAKVIAALRREFGGHAVLPEEG
jgi:6-phosphogluconate dehydrogenase